MNWLMNVSLPVKMVRASYLIEVTYHTPEGRYVEIVKDRRTNRFEKEVVTWPSSSEQP